MMTLTHYGLREWGGALVIAAVLLTGCLYLYRAGHCGWAIGLAIPIVLVFFSIAFFFRSPSRKIPQIPEEILSPADGVVRDIGSVEFSQEPFPGQAKRIGIFLSVFNVHVNRAPAVWQVVSKVYREGRYLDARNPDCAKENEAMTLAGTAVIGDYKFPMAVRQISGAIARRIVCPVEPGRNLGKGEIYGMIKFGSRTELYLPDNDDFEILVKPGDVVRAGLTVMARLRKNETPENQK